MGKNRSGTNFRNLRLNRLQGKEVLDQIIEFLIAQTGNVPHNIAVPPFRKDIAKFNVMAVMHIGGCTPDAPKCGSIKFIPRIVIGFRPDIVEKSVGEIFAVMTVGTT